MCFLGETCEMEINGEIYVDWFQIKTTHSTILDLNID